MSLLKTYARLWTIDSGVVMVVTDLHGDGEAYRLCRDRFMALREAEQADYLVFTGDLIHGRDQRMRDASIDIIADILRLQQQYGDAIIYLCGNHEMPHIYDFGLAQGNIEFTPVFEKAITTSGLREEITQLFQALPLYLRTRAGVAITHAGAGYATVHEENALRLFQLDHNAEFREAESSLEGEDITGLQEAYARMSGARSYCELVAHYLDVHSPDDPRYNNLLRGAMATTNHNFNLLHDALFTRCEKIYGEHYPELLQCLLRHLSREYEPQRLLVAGHIGISGGHAVVNNQHLRLASATHAKPREAGEYLLFDAALPFYEMTELLPHLHPVFQPQ
jgi:hypothetical protein